MHSCFFLVIVGILCVYSFELSSKGIFDPATSNVRDGLMLKTNQVPWVDDGQGECGPQGFLEVAPVGRLSFCSRRPSGRGYELRPDRR